MAEPLAILGGVGAGLQLVSAASMALLATVKLIKDLEEVPIRLATLLDEVSSSISRLLHSCGQGARVYQSLEPSQARRLQQCAVALQAHLRDIHDVLAPLFSKMKGGAARPVKTLWKSFLSIKIEKDLAEKLQHLNRLNIDMTRELCIVGLEAQLDTQDMVMASYTASNQGAANIETKMDLLQQEFRKFTISVQKAHTVSLEDAKDVTERSDSSVCRVDTAFSAATETTFYETEYNVENTDGVSKEREAQILSYLASSPGPATIITPSTQPNARLDHLLLGIQTFYSPGNYDNSTTVAPRPKFWEDTDLAIYLMKVSKGAQRGASQSELRGFRILKESTAQAANTLGQSTSTIIIELLSTLSPVNTTACPYVREGLLRFLKELAREQLPATHPIALVISTLHALSAEGETAVSARSLEFILDRFRSTVGPLHGLTQLTTYRLCGLLRRNGDYAQALDVASRGIRAIRGVVGCSGSLPERWLSRQLEHVYMDQGNWVAALDVCFEIVGQRNLTANPNSNPDPLHHDECAVMTMEDVAKACECAGNAERAIAWLKQAAVSGAMVWGGQTEALAHIEDKLGELHRQVGRTQDIEFWGTR